MAISAKMQASVNKQLARGDTSVASLASPSTSVSSPTISSPVKTGATGTDAFNTAFSALTPQEQANYLGTGSGINVGGVNASFTQGNVGANADLVNKLYGTSINPTTLKTPVVAPNIPSPITTNTNYAGAASSATTPPVVTTPTTEATQPQSDYSKTVTSLMDKYLKKPESMVDINTKLENQNQLQQKQQTVNDLTSQLNAITAKQQANLLQLRQTGSQNGVTEAVYGGQQNEINREAAIQSLPVAAQLAAAQGNLKTAEDHINTLLGLYKADAEAQSSYNTQLFTAAMSVASEDQKTQLTELQRQQDLQDMNIKDISNQKDTMVKAAISSVDFALAGKIANVSLTDPQAMTKLETLSKTNILTNSNSLTKTQIADGAVKAGVDMDTFAGYDKDVQAFFTQTTEANLQPIKDELTNVADGDETVTEFNSFIDKQTLSTPVKTFLKSQATEASVQASTTPKQGFISKIWNAVF